MDRGRQGRVPMPARQPSSPPAGRSGFDTTHWTLICRARDPGDPGCADALEELCSAYWYPLYAYVRRRGHSPDDAQDLTQAFFCRLCSRDVLQVADRDKGKFRTFLLLAMKRFLADEWRHASAQKRGGGCPHVSIDQDWAEGLYRYEPAEYTTPDVLYERQWALLVLERALDAVEHEMTRIGRQPLFAELKNTLTGAAASGTYAEIGRRLGMSEDAMKAAAYRMRRRLRHHVRDAVRQTVSAREDVEEELKHLLTVFSG